MTAEYGAPTQLEKIDMLDYANYIVINKFEKKGSEDALREVIIHYIRTHNLSVEHTTPLLELDLPIFATSSNQFNNHGVNKFFKALVEVLEKEKDGNLGVKHHYVDILPTELQRDFGLIDNKHINYLSEISEVVRNYHKKVEEQVEIAQDVQALKESMKLID
jgi:methylmalonyl-CoA mutase